jgi:hypothetical protein
MRTTASSAAPAATEIVLSVLHGNTCGDPHFGTYYEASPIIAYDGAATRRFPSQRCALDRFGLPHAALVALPTHARCMTRWDPNTRCCALIRGGRGSPPSQRPDNGAYRSPLSMSTRARRKRGVSAKHEHFQGLIFRKINSLTSSERSEESTRSDFRRRSPRERSIASRRSFATQTPLRMTETNSETNVSQREWLLAIASVLL